MRGGNAPSLICRNRNDIKLRSCQQSLHLLAGVAPIGDDQRLNHYGR
jgi:hypothetical protein